MKYVNCDEKENAFSVIDVDLSSYFLGSLQQSFSTWVCDSAVDYTWSQIDDRYKWSTGSNPGPGRNVIIDAPKIERNWEKNWVKLGQGSQTRTST